MNKKDFINSLRANLEGLAQIEIDKSTAYYSEMIDDRIEDGATEEEAVTALGDPATVASAIKYQQPLGVLIKNRATEGAKKIKKNIEKNNVSVLMIVLLVCAFPIWFPLLVAAFVVALALAIVLTTLIIVAYVVIFVIFVAMYAIVFALGLGGIWAIAGSVYSFATISALNGMFWLGGGLAAIGLSLLCIYPIFLASRQVIRGTGGIARGVKGLFIKRNKKNATEEATV